MVMRDSVSYLMNYEISILFVRFVIKHSFQKNSLPIACQKNSCSLEKNSRFLW